MKLTAYLRGCYMALAGGADWSSYMRLGPRGLYESYIGLLITLPAYYVCAYAVSVQRAAISGEAAIGVPLLVFAFAALLYALVFSAAIYLITFVTRPERFTPWVIVRHWSLFFCVLLAAGGFSLFLLGILPFALANMAAFLAYGFTLLVDIILAKRMGGFSWTAAVLIGCAIKAAELSVLLIGIVQIAGMGSAG